MLYGACNFLCMAYNRCNGSVFALRTKIAPQEAIREDTHMARVYNFSPGPSMLAEEVLQKAQKELVEYGAAGMSVMEMSHRSKMYLEI